VKTLFKRAYTHCSSDDDLQAEIKYLCELFKNNGYPKYFIDKDKKSTRTQPNTNFPADLTTRIKLDDNKTQWRSLPYINGVSEAVSRQLSKYGIKVAHKPSSTLYTQLVRPKDEIPPLNKKEVVYRIPCSECDTVYCGQTGKMLCSRLHEHQLAVRRRDHLSLVAMHSLDTGHRFNWNECKVIGSAHSKKSREFIESWNSTENCINRRIDLDPIY
jgi:hypothetical protein